MHACLCVRTYSGAEGLRGYSVGLKTTENKKENKNKRENKKGKHIYVSFRINGTQADQQESSVSHFLE
jgi:hypothetical protein